MLSSFLYHWHLVKIGLCAQRSQLTLNKLNSFCHSTIWCECLVICQQTTPMLSHLSIARFVPLITNFWKAIPSRCYKAYTTVDVLLSGLLSGVIIGHHSKGIWLAHILCNAFFQCKSDLKSDEEIFAEKTREVKQLREQLAEMVWQHFMIHNGRTRKISVFDKK